MLPPLLSALGLVIVAAVAGIADARSTNGGFRKGLGFREAQLRKHNAAVKGAQEPPARRQYDVFPEQWFEQPLDHFNNETGDTFLQRYWFSKRHYTPGAGGPVIVLDGGETSGEVSHGRSSSSVDLRSCRYRDRVVYPSSTRG